MHFFQTRRGLTIFSRLRKSILKRKARLRDPKGYLLAQKQGADWLLNHNSYAGRQLGVFHDFEGRQIAALLGSDRGPFDLFLDIGTQDAAAASNGAQAWPASDT